ncbi:GntR family transcriptional regulator [Nonomuraea basaltis]|uniref:GntR family transcriptional regulator n=1 Tax=Nonomuraea basaltis TaxID=2495887 RepID=UPI00110C4333|nr:GntR family transcriptional regulator [Nonomuraea basaltis]TMR99488.1 GntR family transcriptional regulator [Nonomuraea basaltis]
MVRHEEVSDDLRAKILDGTYPAGKPLPHSQLLAIEHGVSLSTVSQALATLKAEQLVIRHAAEGMIVQPPLTVVDLVLHGPHGHGPLPWAKCCERSGTEGAMVTGKVATSKAAPDLAVLLGVDVGDEVITRNRRATIGDTVVRLDEAIYPHRLVHDTPLTRRGQVPGGVYRALASAGLEPHKVVRRVIANRQATDAEAKALRLVRRALVLTYEQVIADREGTRIELMRFVANPARIRFVDEQVAL